MASKAGAGRAWSRHRWRILGWAGAAALLLLPRVANAPWTLSDFIVMGALLGLVGGFVELSFRMSRSTAYRAGAAVAVLACFLLTWINLAVGIIGDERNPLNLIYVGVIGSALVGAIVARFEAAAMTRAMAVTTVLQMLAGVVAVLAGGYASPGPVGLALLNGAFAGMFALAAALFRTAARDPLSRA